MTANLAIDIIASATQISVGKAADILIGYELATNLSIGDEVLWDELPLGAGTDIISFIRSGRVPETGSSYGDIARAWLLFRLEDRLAYTHPNA